MAGRGWARLVLRMIHSTMASYHSGWPYQRHDLARKNHVRQSGHTSNRKAFTSCCPILFSQSPPLPSHVQVTSPSLSPHNSTAKPPHHTQWPKPRKTRCTACPNKK